MRHVGQDQPRLHRRQAGRVAGQQIGQRPHRLQIECSLARHAFRQRQTRQIGRRGPGGQGDGGSRIEGHARRLAGQGQAQAVIRQVRRQRRPPLGQAHRQSALGQQSAGQGQTGDLQYPVAGHFARPCGIAGETQAALAVRLRRQGHVRQGQRRRPARMDNVDEGVGQGHVGQRQHAAARAAARHQGRQIAPAEGAVLDRQGKLHPFQG